MKTAIRRLLLIPQRFRVDGLFRMGQVGWAHWYDNPDDLYRRRNFHSYTNAMNAGGWATTTATVTPNSATAPDGTNTAALVTASNTAVNQGFAYQSVLTSMVSVRSGVHTLSAYWKAGTSTGGRIQSTFSADGTPCGASIGVNAAGTVTVAPTGYGAPISGVTGGSESVGNGWYRLWISFTLNASAVTAAPNWVFPYQTVGETAPCTAYFWGVQFERGPLTGCQPVPTTWEDAYLAAVGAERIFAWQDSAGTTPVTAVGQSVGLVLDRAYGGARGANMAFAGYATQSGYTNVTTAVSATAFTQTTGATSGRTYLDLVTEVGKTYELTAQVTTDDATGCTAFARAGTGGGGTDLSTSNTVSTTGTQRLIFTAVSTASTILWSTTNLTKIVSATGISLRQIPGTHRIQATSASRPTLSARVNLLLNTATMSTQNVTTIAASYKLSFTGTGTVTLSGTSTAGPLVGTGVSDRVSLTFTPTAGTLTLTVSGSVTLADLRTADDAAKLIPAYQRVGATAADHDTDGFPHGSYPDGTDDFDTTSTGGGGSSGFFFCGVLTVSGGAGTARTIWSDTGTNTGYRVRINASNKLELAAGNGTAYTTVQSNETITAPGTYLLSAWDDGGVLAVQVGNAAAATTTRPTVSAGTSAITSYRDNGAATSYFNGRDYGSVYRQTYPGETAHNRLKAWQARRAGITV